MTLQFSGSGNPVTVDGTNYGLYPTIMTAQNTTSGTAFDFGGIPSWVRRITVMCSNVLASTTSNYIVQAGTSGGIVTTGYTSVAYEVVSAGGVGSLLSDGWNVQKTNANQVFQGMIILTLLDPSTNTWTGTTVATSTGVLAAMVGTAYISLSGALTQIRYTTTAAGGTFSAGKINVMYE